MTGAAVALAVAIGGAFGSLARFGLERATRRRFGNAFPWWSFVINPSGAFALGVLLGYATHHDVHPIITAGFGTGFIGAYTMLAPINIDGPRIWVAGRRMHGAAAMLGGYAVSLAAATLGLWIAGGI